MLGAGLFYSVENSHRFINSDVRYLEMLNTSRELLSQPVQYSTAKLPLGEIAGTSNGFCDVIYEYFDAQVYPDWLTQLRLHQSNGTSCALLREFDLINSSGPVTTRVLSADNTSFIDRDVCRTYSEGNSLFFQRAVQNRNIALTVIGDHPVAGEIATQVERLPVTLNWITDIQQANDTLSNAKVIVVMTSNHEVDYQLCELALKLKAEFIGCIGSEKKAALFKKRFLQNGVTEAQIQRLHMPVGMLQIGGKQISVVAASIVAQILAQHQW